MIGYTHIEVLRDQIAEAERQLAGWRYLLAHAEQVERAGTVLPDPIVAAPTAEQWPAPPTPPVVPAGLPPYQNGSVWDGMLPPKQEAAIAAVLSDHDAHARTPDAAKEDQKWQQA